MATGTDQARAIRAALSAATLTEADIARIFTEAGVDNISPVLLQYMRGTLADAAEQTEEVWNELVSRLRGPANPAVLSAAVDSATRAADTFARLQESQLRALAQEIRRGLDDGLDSVALGRRLKLVEGLDAGRAATLDKYCRYLEAKGYDGAKLDDALARRKAVLLRQRREMIAQTEMRYAQGEGDMSAAKASGRTHKVWITSGDDRVSDECKANEAAGWIGIDKAFPGGVQTVPQHPGCRCTVSYRANQPGPRATARANARAAKTAAAVDPLE